jgi:uncharacterized tellurite resistance protein B-like protein
MVDIAATGRQISEAEYLAFYGALVSIAAADGSIGEEERDIISSAIEDLPDETKQQIHTYFTHPPTLEESLDKLAQASELMRFRLMISLVSVSWADDQFLPQEKQAVDLAKEKFGITDEQVQAIMSYIQETRALTTETLDYSSAASIISKAVARLTAAGIPSAAAYI